MTSKRAAPEWVSTAMVARNTMPNPFVTREIRTTRAIVADHEAAHIVAGHRMGFEIRGARITREGGVWTGRCTTGDEPLSNRLGSLVMATAGTVAEHLFHGNPEFGLSDGDFLEYQQIVGGPDVMMSLQGVDEFTQVWKLTRALIWSERRRVRGIGRSLSKNRVLSGSDVIRLMRYPF